MNYQQVYGITAGALGAICTYMIGGWSELFGALLFFILLDVVTGLFASVISSKQNRGTGLSSQIGFKGLAKKLFILIAVVIAHRLDVLMGTQVLASGVMWAYIALELLSITENFSRAGVPMPKVLTDIIEVIKQKNNIETKKDDSTN